MKHKFYTVDHEWVEVEEDMGIIGITDFAQNALGDVVYVELPDANAAYNTGDEIAVVESVKAASEILTPIAGIIIESNESLIDDPSLVNTSPENDGWFIKIKITNIDELATLMTADEYNTFISEL